MFFLLPTRDHSAFIVNKPFMKKIKLKTSTYPLPLNHSNYHHYNHYILSQNIAENKQKGNKDQQ